MPPNRSPRLFLVDGYALIYRAFFAMIGRPLKTSRGENTSAVWGVANFLHRLFAEYNPEHIAWVHDAGTSFRENVFPDYKATREKLDEELQEDFDRSVERIEELLHHFGVPLVAVEGYEADDVIGTLAKAAEEAGYQAVIISGDKDFYQLISPSVALLNPGRRGPAAVDEQWVDLTNAAERLGVPPNRVVDFLALVGDSSDNVPGVRGIGEKTARALIEAYGDLDAILAHADEVKGKRAREGLIQHAEEARLSRELVTIRCDVPVGREVPELKVRRRDDDSLRKLYAELEFHSLQEKLGAEKRSEGQTVIPFMVVDSVGDLPSIVRTLREGLIVSVDVTATAVEPVGAAVVGVSVAIEGSAWYFPVGHELGEGVLIGASAPDNLPPLNSPDMLPLRDLLEDPEVPKSGHDIKYASLVLRQAGVELRGMAYDTTLACFLLEPGKRSYEIDVLAAEYLDTRLTPHVDLVGRGRTERPFAEVPVEQAAAYSCGRASAVIALRQFFDPQLETLELGSLLVQIDIPLIEVLADMEFRGIAVDEAGLTVLAEQFAAELSDLNQAIHRVAGTDFNINSTPQLRHVLFEKLNLPVLKKTKTGPSTDAEVLEGLAAMGHELPRLMLEYRELSKLQSTYVDVLPRRVNPATRRIHTRFSQTGAATGRLASSDPNLQNIPVRTTRGEAIRRCFVPDRGKRFVVADYSQIELRLLAHLSRDPQFVEAFRRGGDIHRETASVIFDVSLDQVTADMRSQAKTINFATIYGQGPFSLSKQLGISKEEARAFIDLYFERFAGVRRFLDDCIASAQELGYAETLFGRRRYIPELKDRNFNVRSFGERVAMNSPLQGSAADLIKRAMLGAAKAFAERNLEGGMLLQVHDELVVEVPVAEVAEVKELVRREMEGAAELSVPLVVDIGDGENWLDAKA
jgi:DNA polymerase-1